jgi:hypothetical protein
VFNLFAQKNNERILLWQTRTQSTTNDILIQINKSRSSERVFYYAKLGEIWWEKDQKEGKQYLEKAVEYAVSPATDYKNFKEQISKLRDLLKIVSPKDASLEKKIISKLNELSVGENTGENNLNSDAILETAVLLVDIDIQRAYNLGVSTLKQKQPVFSFRSVRLFLNIRNKNEILANNFYKQALEVAKLNVSDDFIDNLFRISFPESYEFPPVSDDSLRKHFLGILSQNIQTEAQNVLEKKQENCNFTKYYGVKIFNQYKQLLPEKTVVIEKAIGICQVSDEIKNKDGLSPDEQPKTIEDYLELAKLTNDKKLRNKYLLEAALIANQQQKKFKLAIEILDQIDDDERNTPPAVWDIERLTATTSLIIELIENNYLQDVNETIKKSPAKLRPEIRISVADKLDSVKNKLYGYELLNEAKVELAKTDFKFSSASPVFINSPLSYKNLTDLYLTFGYQPDAIETFDDSIKSLNRYVADTPEDNIPSLKRSVNWKVFADFPDKFIEVYFQRIERGFAEIENIPIKLDIQLQWLKNSLKKQIEVEKEFAKKSEVKKK